MKMKIVKISNLRTMGDVRAAIAGARGLGDPVVRLADCALNVTHVIMTLNDYEALVARASRQPKPTQTEGVCHAKMY
jgi:hypothetical protein